MGFSYFFVMLVVILAKSSFGFKDMQIKEIAMDLRLSNKTHGYEIIEKLLSHRFVSYSLLNYKGELFLRVYTTSDRVDILRALDHGFVQQEDPVQKRNTPEGDYLSHTQLIDHLLNISLRCPLISRMESIGMSVEGREIVSIVFGKKKKHVLTPRVKMVGNIHGDEVVGRELILLLASYLCDTYYAPQAMNDTYDVQRIVNTTEIWLIPTMNPDGFFHKRRTNKNFVDLNRNFPDIRFGGRETTPLQPETLSIIHLSRKHKFVGSISFHGGAVVVNYPYDGNNLTYFPSYEKTLDDAVFRHVALSYARENKDMWESLQFVNGITNGANWYPIYGGMQDWNYEVNHCMELTIEVSAEKYPPRDSIHSFWGQNKRSMMQFLFAFHTGVKGIVTSSTLTPMNATVCIQELNHCINTDPLDGSYFHILTPGTYTLICTQTNHTEITKRITLTQKNNMIVYNITLYLSQ